MEEECLPGYANSASSVTQENDNSHKKVNQLQSDQPSMTRKSNHHLQSPREHSPRCGFGGMFNDSAFKKRERKMSRESAAGRIKGIEPYVSKWSVVWRGRPMSKVRKSTSGRRKSSVAVKRRKNKNNADIYTFSIYKDGSVQ